ncbi:Hcp family type VI secretion system effector [Cohnella yongneupensis]|uniref:Hcp family type VI secretion system effector n=1 Tax=Cohnella yongneupensis TaxID=425006 RepID=A0ABW0R0V8_9BACL
MLAFIVACALALTFSTFAGTAASINESQQPLNYDIYLKLDGIDGESIVRGYEKWIPLASVQLGVTNVVSRTSTGIAAGKATPGPLVIMKRPDSSTLPIFLAITSGKVILKGTIAFVKPGVSPVAPLTYELGNILVSSFSTDNGFETIELTYDSIVIGYATQNATGTLNAPVKGGWNFAKNIKL